MSYNRLIRRASLVLSVVLLLLTLVPPRPSYAYSETPGKTHSWLTRKALAYLKERRPDLAAKFPLDLYVHALDLGNQYADNTNELVCHWDLGPHGDDIVYACDALHHYGKLEVIETEYNIDAGHPGEFAAPQYVPALFEVALKFWPGGAKPDLGQLTKKNAGYITNPLYSVWVTSSAWPVWRRVETSLGGHIHFGDTYLGGVPYCEIVYGKDACPQWPGWASGASTRDAVESVTNSMRYLGWTLHVLQDLTVPYHARNTAASVHRDYENDVEGKVSAQRFEHLPATYGTQYSNGDKVDVGTNFRYFAPWDRQQHKNPFYFSPTQLAEEAMKYGDQSPTMERRLDAAIKLSAALMENFFDHVAPQGEMEYVYLVHRYSGKYLFSDATADGGVIGLRGPIPSGGEDRHSFELVPTGDSDGFYYLVHKYSGRYVHPQWIFPRGPTQLQLRGAIPSGDENYYKFSAVPVGDGYYYLQHKVTGAYVCSGDGRAVSTSRMGEEQVDRCQFKLIGRTSVDQGQLLVNRLSSKCIDVRGKPGVANESVLQLWNCECRDPNTDQKWKITADGFIKNKLSGKCIDVKGKPGVANESPLQLWDCESSDPNTDQKWEITPDGFIKNKLSGKCIDVKGTPGVANESILQLWDCEYSNLNTDQKWGLKSYCLP